MKKDGIWIDEEDTGRIVDTFSLPCLPAAPKPRLEPGELAVRVGTTDVYQVVDYEVDLLERRTREGIGGYEREEISYLAQKVHILTPKRALVPCEVGPVTRLRDRELQPLPPGSRLLAPRPAAIERRSHVDLVGASRPVHALPSTRTARPSLPKPANAALPAPARLIEGDGLP